jgi:hypothetical protein
LYLAPSTWFRSSSTRQKLEADELKKEKGKVSLQADPDAPSILFLEH